MSEHDSVVCATHGETAATFTCQHVAGGVGCGFHVSVEDPEDRWPDAWCDLCEDAFQAEGEWNDVSNQTLGAKVMCTHCYEAARALNQSPPLHARGAATRLTNDEVERLIHHAVHATQKLQAARPELNRSWGRWDYDDVRSTLTFSDETGTPSIATVRMVGSYSTRSNTFQWAWKTLTGGPDAVPSDRVRRFGEVRGIEKLTTPNWPAEEMDGWEMAALASYLLGSGGIYRAPFDHTYWFMLLSDWRTEH